MPFMLAISAVSAIKQGVAIYKDAKNVGKEVFGIYAELSEGVGNFFDHQEKAHKEIKEKEKNPPKGKSIKSQALDNVIKKKQLQQAEYDLRQLLTYQAPPELGALWTDFQEERARLEKDKAKYEQAQKKRMSKNITEKQETKKNGILELQYALQSWWFSSQLLD
jgi:ABC-type xylose transport system substrate-binding protein